LREETINGAACYVIQSIPKDTAYQYSKMVSWIDKQNSVLYKMELYDRRGKLVKTMENSKFEDVDGRLTAKTMTVKTVEAGTSTTINIEIIRYDANIPESVFTTQYIETGRS
jgi:negative regulator of sigma E activity